MNLAGARRRLESGWLLKGSGDRDLRLPPNWTGTLRFVIVGGRAKRVLAGLPAHYFLKINRLQSKISLIVSSCKLGDQNGFFDDGCR